MQVGKQRAEWDHTANLIAHIRSAAGEAKSDPRTYHPFLRAAAAKAAFKKLSRAAQKEQSQ